MSVSKTNKIKLALTGPSSAPKLLTALQLGYELCRNWNRIIVLGSSTGDGMYRHLGPYQTLRIEKDSPPSRYTELLNIAASCTDVIIFSSLSDEWIYGTCQHLHSSYYPDVLSAHRTLFTILQHLPAHVIGLIETRTALLQKDRSGKRRLRCERLQQQDDVADYFTTLLNQDKRGWATVCKDETEVFPSGTPFRIGFDTGTLLRDWCRNPVPASTEDMQHKIDNCTSVEELYRLLFECDDTELLACFAQKKLTLDAGAGERETLPRLQPWKGGLSC